MISISPEFEKTGDFDIRAGKFKSGALAIHYDVLVTFLCREQYWSSLQKIWFRADYTTIHRSAVEAFHNNLQHPPFIPLLLAPDLVVDVGGTRYVVELKLLTILQINSRKVAYSNFLEQARQLREDTGVLWWSKSKTEEFVGRERRGMGKHTRVLSLDVAADYARCASR